MKIYTAAEMREHEQMAVDKGTTFEQLMENAGQAAAADLLRRFHKAGRALIVCGKGKINLIAPSFSDGLRPSENTISKPFPQIRLQTYSGLNLNQDKAASRRQYK